MAHFEKLQKIISGNGFIAALDQSGGSTPKALLQYDVGQTYYKNDTEMYDQIHSMRARIVSSPSFNSKNIIGAILFEMNLGAFARLRASATRCRWPPDIWCGLRRANFSRRVSLSISATRASILSLDSLF